MDICGIYVILHNSDYWKTENVIRELTLLVMFLDPKKITDSERGGRSAIRGFQYEKNIIALLCIRMYCNREKIQSVICEYRNDIEVEHEDLGLCSWQIKTSGTKNLSKKELLSSLQLFNELNSQDRYKNFILLNDNDIPYNEFTTNHIYSFNDLKPKLQQIIRDHNFSEELLSKLNFVKGPSQESIRANIEREVTCAKDREHLVNVILRLIDEIWGGITELKDMKFVKFNERVDQEKTFKTINKFRIDNLIKSELNNNHTSVGRKDKLSSFEYEGKILEYSYGTFQSIQKKINNIELQRAETEEVISALTTSDRVVLTGVKGSGKSVIMCQVYEILKSNDNIVIFVRGDWFGNIKSENDIDFIIYEKLSLLEFLSHFRNTKKFVLMIDSLDAISREIKTFHIFIRYITKVWGLGIPTILSIRDYDYTYSKFINGESLGKKIIITGLSEDNLNLFLNKLGVSLDNSRLRPILKNPFNLLLFTQLYLDGQIVNYQTINNEFELFNKYWNEYIEKSISPSKTAGYLYKLCNLMVKEKKLYVVLESFDCDTEVNILLNNGILERRRGTIGFVHHAYFDYIYSRYLNRTFIDYSKFLDNQKYNIFLRPTIKFALDYLYTTDLSKYLKNILLMLTSNIMFYWKISALVSFAEKIDYHDQEIVSIQSVIQNDTLIQRHFLIALIKCGNLYWIKKWGNSLLLHLSKEKYNSGYLVDYLKNGISDISLHKIILSLIQNVVNTSSNGIILNNAIEITSGIDLPEKSEWYRSLSLSSSSFIRKGVLNCMPEHIRVDPKSFAVVFNNIFSYEEVTEDSVGISKIGSLSIQMSAIQHNKTVLYTACNLFPSLLQINPLSCVESLIKIIENKHGNEFVIFEDVIDVRQNRWYKIQFLNNEELDKLLSYIHTYLENAVLSDNHKIIEAISNTKLSILHSFLLEELNKSPEKFYHTILNELLKNGILCIFNLRHTVGASIKSISHLLSVDDATSLIKKILSIDLSPYKAVEGGSYDPYLGLSNLDLHDEDDKFLLENKIKKYFLDLIPTRYYNETVNKFLAGLQSDVSEVVETDNVVKSSKLLDDASIYHQNLPTEPRYQKSELVIKNNLLDELSKILSNSNFDLSQIEFIKLILIPLVEYPDPCIEEPPDSLSKINNYPVSSGIRGKTALNLILLYIKSRDKSLLKYIEKLLLDPITNVKWIGVKYLPLLVENDVESSFIKRVIHNLFRNNNHEIIKLNLAFSIAAFLRKYSLDKDVVVKIRDILLIADGVDEKEYIVERFIDDLIKLITKLSIEDKSEDINKLVKYILEDKTITDKVKRRFVYFIKDPYLISDNFQEEAFGYLSILINDSNHETRNHATNALFYTIEQNVEKIKDIQKTMNLTKNLMNEIIEELEKSPYDPRIIEDFIAFLVKFPLYFYKESPYYLYRITNADIELIYNQNIAENTISILNRCLNDTSLQEKDREICLEVLNTFAQHGWSEALNILDSIGQRD